MLSHSSLPISPWQEHECKSIPVMLVLWTGRLHFLRGLESMRQKWSSKRPEGAETDGPWRLGWLMRGASAEQARRLSNDSVCAPHRGWGAQTCSAKLVPVTCLPTCQVEKIKVFFYWNNAFSPEAEHKGHS